MCELFGEQLDVSFVRGSSLRTRICPFMRFIQSVELQICLQGPKSDSSNEQDDAVSSTGPGPDGQWGHDRPTWATLGNIGDELVNAELFEMGKSAMHAGWHQSVAQQKPGRTVWVR